MTIDADGNVGINQASIGTEAHPDTKLYVTGALTFGEVAFASQASLPAIVQSSSDGAAQDLTIGTRSATGSVRFFTGAVDTAGDFGTNGSSEAMRIDASGNVGIGTTPDALEGLNVKNTKNIGFAEAGGAYANMFRQNNTAALILAQGYKQHPSPGGFACSMAGNFGKSAISVGNFIEFFVDDYSDVPVGTKVEPTQVMSIDYNGRVDISGSLYVNGTPKIGYSELITTLVTLRKATMDETQDIRESLRDAIDELVAGFEQEIAAMPAPEPEVSTQEIPE
jgi:hypothetical protein